MTLPREAGAPLLFSCLAFSGFIVGVALAAMLWWLL